MIDRRFFLKSSGLALVGGTLLPNVFVRMANAAATKGNKTLVAIFQRGAVDECRRRIVGNEPLAEFEGDVMRGGGMMREDVNHLLALRDAAAGRKADA